MSLKQCHAASMAVHPQCLGYVQTILFSIESYGLFLEIAMNTSWNFFTFLELHS